MKKQAIKPDTTSPLHCGQTVYGYAPCIYLGEGDNPMVKPHLATYRVINSHDDDVCILDGGTVRFTKRENLSATPLPEPKPKK
jgi:hypothetical protein